MTDRQEERLVELLEQTGMLDSEARCKIAAEELLANGVIVPPCKVGDEVYYVHETYWDKNYEDYIETEEFKQGVLKIVERPEPKMNLMLQVKEFDWCLISDWLNGNIFLTKKEAEAKLKELKDNDR